MNLKVGAIALSVYHSRNNLIGNTTRRVDTCMARWVTNRDASFYVTVVTVEIHWPNGTTELKLPSVYRIFTVEEGKGITGEYCPACG